MSWHNQHLSESPLHRVSFTEVGGIPRGGILSPELEYPPCPKCDDNEGIFTSVCQNKSRFRCHKCTSEYGDLDSFTTIRDLQKPLIEDYIACVINKQDIESRAAETCRKKSEVKSNLEDADNFLSKGWLGQMDSEGIR